MEIPALEELREIPLEKNDLINFLKSMRLSERPLYIDMSYFAPDRQGEQLNLLEAALNEIGFATFPYPFYVITPHFKNRPPMTLVKKRGELPAHFKMKKRRPTPKEEILLSKIETHAMRIRSYQQSELLASLRSKLQLRRETKNLHHQINFLKSVIEKLKKDGP